MSESTKLKIHIVSHTHWDRAWYLTFQQFRYRLVILIDKLIELLKNNSDYKSFHLDGQTIVLEDYLEIRPEKSDILSQLIKEGRIIVGPWYVLHDEFLVSGESTIRNLLLGNKTGKKIGKISNTGYIPDAFGHIAQMPQILKGFNIDNCIFTRGMGDELDDLGTEFLWEAPDESSVLAINQLNNYGNGAHLGYKNYWDNNVENIEPDVDVALKKIEKEIKELKSFSNSHNILINNGCDHLYPQAQLPEIIEYIQEKHPEHEFSHTTFQKYVSEIKKIEKKLKKFTGEFRSGKRHPLLNGVYSTRMNLKQLNHNSQLSLEKYAEPTSVVSYKLNVKDYPVSFLENAWKLLLKNHPHDNICGCSTDQVHREMIPEFDQVVQISDEIVYDNLFYIGKNLKTDNFQDCHSLLIFNSLPFIRSEPINRIVILPPEMEADYYEIIDENGEPVPCYFNNVFRLKKCDIIEYAPNGMNEEYRNKFLDFIKNNDNLFVGKNFPGEYYIVLDLVFLAENIPGVGYRAFFVKQSNKPRKCEGNVTVSGNNIENKYFKVSVKSNGSFDIYVKETQKHIRNLHVFKDSEDAGDEYDYAPSSRGETFTSEDIQGEIVVKENNPLRGSIESKVKLNLPESLEKDRKSRKKTFRELPASVLVSLKSDTPVIEISTKIDNTVDDHRLRVHFSVPVKTDYSISDAQFCTMKRDIDIKTTKGWKQKPQGTHPQQNFSLIEDKNMGLAVLNKGLPEFEALHTKDGTELALTLLRSTGWLSRNDLSTRPYNAGPMIETLEAQCRGMHEFNYAVYLYDNSWLKDKVQKYSLIYNCPLITTTAETGKGKLPLHYSFMEISTDEIILCALKKAENRNSIICRFYNITDKNINTIVKFFYSFKECWRVNLKEERIESLPVNGSKIHLKMPGCKIETLEIV